MPADWDSQTPGTNTGFGRVRHLQNISDLVDRPLNNRLSVVAPATPIACSGAAESSGIGVGPMQPKRYAEFTVKARVSFSIVGVGPAYIFVYRTKAPSSTVSAIPAAGASPNLGDVIVGGDAFMGGPMVSGLNQSGSFSFLDTGLSVTGQYSYYCLAAGGPAGQVLTLGANSQLLVMERS